MTGGSSFGALCDLYLLCLIPAQQQRFLIVFGPTINNKDDFLAQESTIQTTTTTTTTLIKVMDVCFCLASLSFTGQPVVALFVCCLLSMFVSFFLFLLVAVVCLVRVVVCLFVAGRFLVVIVSCCLFTFVFCCPVFVCLSVLVIA